MEGLEERVTKLELLGPRFYGGNVENNSEMELLKSEKEVLQARVEKLEYRIKFLLRALDDRDEKKKE